MTDHDHDSGSGARRLPSASEIIARMLTSILSDTPVPLSEVEHELRRDIDVGARSHHLLHALEGMEADGHIRRFTRADGVDCLEML